MWVRVLTLHLEVGSENNGGTTSRGSVDWASVETFRSLLVTFDGGNVNDWENWMEILQLHVSQVAFFTTTAIFPTGTFKEETVDVGTILSEFWVFSDVLAVGNCGNKGHTIEWETSSTSSNLGNSGNVGHWVEKS